MEHVPDSVTPLWATAGALIVVLILAWIFSAIARWLLRRRATLDGTTAIVLSIAGSALGLFIAGAIDPRLRIWSPLPVIVALVGSILVIAVYAAIATHLQRDLRMSIPELIAAGESAQVEFKSSARINMRTGAKDPKMEQVIVKTVSAFLNADGGTLLIGVDDAGTPLGLDPDYATLKTPDADRFELWLRDLLTTALGQTAAAAVEVSVEDVEAIPTAETPDNPGSPDSPTTRPVCRVIAGPSPRPVYLRPGKNTPPEFWLRTGNSSRQLGVDQASEYIAHRWPIGAGAALAAQARAAVRLSAGGQM
ncbi:ATP-binding protein [Gordonia desulfuricans]|uniref:ATP-binding protein n=1 Tax=Gordonia desulfuricans TaxID=89051 RepID=A0A7K3LJP0_9ACTN|nr:MULTISPECIES: RNA-binding domain-containing protein [Gordonia]KOY49190.1 ATPase AAA [Gordonia sp. NB41Y]NDK88482.1 ATP-binding protein [Gordonia desulfuricans]WLP92039.1 putative DNA binding domain-containing protein [Gordonia sp. NB41Y]